MAARRNKNQARRNSGNGTPGWVWLVAGLVLGAAAFFIVPGLLKKDGDGFFRPQPNPDAQPAQVVDAAGADELAADTSTATSQPQPKQDDTAAKETQYDFYTLLPGKEVQMSDAELAASARAEQASEARAQKAAADAAAKAAGNDPVPVPETQSVPATATAATQPKPATAAETTPPPAATTMASAEARYILQAGAFGASGDAESTKAKIALLGLSARVESAQIGGKTVYRVRMGPYGSASELAEAKKKLSSGGLPAMAIKAQ